MTGYIVRRLLAGVLVLLATSTSTFILFFAGPVNPAESQCGTRNCPPERIERIERALGLDQPKLKQYADFMGGLFAGRELRAGEWVKQCPAPCFGYSFRQDRPVTEIMAERIPVTVSIAVGGATIFLFVGVVLGVLAAIKRGTVIDKALVGASIGVSSVPYIVVAILAYLYLAVAWQLFPRTGYHNLFGEGGSLIGWVKGLLLAWIVLGLYNTTQYARFSRGSMVETLGEDYVRTARAKGLPNRAVYVKHALRAAIAPVITIFGLELAGLLVSAVFTEQVFQLEGLGRLSLQSVQSGDLPIVMGTVMFTSAVIVIANLVVDVAYSFIDPRVRLA
ncbi:ABC transporter permease [Flindersiella endophytica]